MKEFKAHNFWIDKIQYPELETFHDLAEKLIDDSLKDHQLDWSYGDKKNYIKMWMEYYRDHYGTNFGKNGKSPFATIGYDLVMARIIWHKDFDRKLNNRNRKFLIYTIAKILEKFV